MATSKVSKTPAKEPASKSPVARPAKAVKTPVDTPVNTGSIPGAQPVIAPAPAIPAYPVVFAKCKRGGDIMTAGGSAVASRLIKFHPPARMLFRCDASSVGMSGLSLSAGRLVFDGLHMPQMRECFIDHRRK